MFYFDSVLLSLLRKCLALASLEQKLNPLYVWLVCAKFSLNSPSGSSEKKFDFDNVFSQFRNYLPLEEDMALHQNTLESRSP